MNVTQRIFAIATDKRISLTELAKKIGISYGTIASWKRRGTQPPADKITTIAQALDVPVSYLLEGSEIEPQQICNEHDSNAIVVTDKNEKLLIQNYRALHYARQIQVLSSIITEAESEKNSK